MTLLVAPSEQRRSRRLRVVGEGLGSRGIARVTSQMTDVMMTYSVVRAKAGQLISVPMAGRHHRTRDKRTGTVLRGS